MEELRCKCGKLFTIDKRTGKPHRYRINVELRCGYCYYKHFKQPQDRERSILNKYHNKEQMKMSVNELWNELGISWS